MGNKYSTSEMDFQWDEASLDAINNYYTYFNGRQTNATANNYVYYSPLQNNLFREPQAIKEPEIEILDVDFSE